MAIYSVDQWSVTCSVSQLKEIWRAGLTWAKKMETYSVDQWSATCSVSQKTEIWKVGLTWATRMAI